VNTVGFRFYLTCPLDGHPAELVATGSTSGWATRAVCRCTVCHTQLLLELTVRAPNSRHKVARQHLTEAVGEYRTARRDGLL